jgi:hypothetical protein
MVFSLISKVNSCGTRTFASVTQGCLPFHSPPGPLGCPRDSGEHVGVAFLDDDLAVPIHVDDEFALLVRAAFRSVEVVQMYDRQSKAPAEPAERELKPPLHMARELRGYVKIAFSYLNLHRRHLTTRQYGEMDDSTIRLFGTMPSEKTMDRSLHRCIEQELTRRF